MADRERGRPRYRHQPRFSTHTGGGRFDVPSTDVDDAVEAATDTASGIADWTQRQLKNLGNIVVGQDAPENQSLWLPKAPGKALLAAGSLFEHYKYDLPETTFNNVRLMFLRAKNRAWDMLQQSPLQRKNPWSSYRQAQKNGQAVTDALKALEAADAVPKRAGAIAGAIESSGWKRDGIDLRDIMANPTHPERRGLYAGVKIKNPNNTALRNFARELSETIAHEEVLIERMVLEDAVQALKSPKAWAGFSQRMALTPDDYFAQVRNFEARRTSAATDMRTQHGQRARVGDIESFNKLGADMEGLLRDQNILIERETRAIQRLHDDITRNPTLRVAHEQAIARRLQRIAELEQSAITMSNKFVAENADALRILYKGSKFKEVYMYHPTGSAEVADDVLEKYRLRKGVRPAGRRLSLGFMGGKITLLGIGAGTVISHFSQYGALKGLWEWKEMAGSAAWAGLSFLPIIGTGVDFTDCGRALWHGRFLDAGMNFVFGVAGLASDLTSWAGVGLAGRAAISSAKVARLVAKGGKAVDATGAAVSSAKAVEKVSGARRLASGKIILDVVEEGGQVGFRELPQQAMKQLQQEGIAAKIFRNGEEMARRQMKTLQIISKYGFATGAAMLVGSAAVPLAEWTFGDSTGSRATQIARQAA